MKIIRYSIIVLLLSGCKKNNDNQHINSTEIFPDKVGNSWTYNVHDTTIHFTSDSSFAEYNLTVSIVDSIQLPGGINAHVWVYHYSGTTDTNYVIQKNDTIAFLNKGLGTIGQYIFPLVINNSWQYTPFPSSTFDLATVVAQQDIVVNQQTFKNAFYVVAEGGYPDAQYAVRDWIVNNVGIVKRFYATDGLSGINHVEGWTLISYHLK